MSVDWSQIWFVVIAVAALSGWWLAVRPRATYCAISTTMSFLIVLMAVLLCVLAVSGQYGGRRPAPLQPPAPIGR